MIDKILELYVGSIDKIPFRPIRSIARGLTVGADLPGTIIETVYYGYSKRFHDNPITIGQKSFHHEFRDKRMDESYTINGILFGLGIFGVPIAFLTYCPLAMSLYGLTSAIDLANYVERRFKERKAKRQQELTG
jgi:hypothetical protein